MKRILITQRVDVAAAGEERRDALDQRWIDLLQAADLEPVVVPNNADWVRAHLTAGTDDGLLLSGGNSLVACGGQAPERDAAERQLLRAAVARGTPVLGVCRGMQVILDFFGGKLRPVTGHVAPALTIAVRGEDTVVNSYHDWGATVAPVDLDVWAVAPDGVIKAVRHVHLPVWGVMWHPERCRPFRPADLDLLRRIFGGEAAS